MRLASAACAAVLSLVLAPSAWGATASVIQEPDCTGGDECRYAPGFHPVLDYDAEAGEANSLTVSLAVTSSAVTLKLREAAVTITPGTGCTRVSDNEVDCNMNNTGTVSARAAVDTKDGNDRVVVDSSLSLMSVSIDGGPGDDDLTGGPNAEFLSGGGGRDTIRGGGGADTLADADHSTTVDNDVMDGGSGADNVTYLGRTGPIRVDLLAKTGGQEGETDSLLSIENARGGGRDDTLIGDRAVNILEGESGNDRLIGRAGNDQLRGGFGDDRPSGSDGADFIDGGAGFDRISGGRGNDRIFTGDPRVSGSERPSCGSGLDVIEGADLVDRIGSDCERVDFDDSLEMSRLPIAVGRRNLVFRVYACDLCEASVLQVRRAGPTIAGGTGALLGGARIPEDTPNRIVVRLTAEGRRLFRTGNPVGIEVSLLDEAGEEPSGGYSAVVPAR